MAGRINKAECRALRAQRWSLNRLAARYGVSKPAVSQACRGVVLAADHEEDAMERARARIASRRSTIRGLHAAGQPPKAIAYLLSLSIGTVYSHLPPIRTPRAGKAQASDGASREAAACR